MWNLTLNLGLLRSGDHDHKILAACDVLSAKNAVLWTREVIVDQFIVTSGAGKLRFGSKGDRSMMKWCEMFGGERRKLRTSWSGGVWPGVFRACYLEHERSCCRGLPLALRELFQNCECSPNTNESVYGVSKKAGANASSQRIWKLWRHMEFPYKPLNLSLAPSVLALNTLQCSLKYL